MMVAMEVAITIIPRQCSGLYVVVETNQDEHFRAVKLQQVLAILVEGEYFS
jgi:hypothetical protein